ncbi:MAG: hypothetical protein LR015_04805 [Verrucomicrobia bacterium]|nr:hypothetical protein [Verrucomicrobiota bacterium]
MSHPSLEAQRAEFSSRRFLAMPLAGTIAWLSVAIAGSFLATYNAAIILFVATGMIVYLGIFISKFTGEDFGKKKAYRNTFDSLFFHGVGMSLLVYAIAIPFFLIDYTSLPLTVGFLTGLMWIPMSWIIQHWVGIFHTVARTLSIVVLWYWLPDQRFVAIPLAIVVIYLITISS